MKIAIVSDIHGNYEALSSVLLDAKEYDVDAYISLGDVIDYGMHSNEVIELLEGIPYQCLGSIWGNHEDAIVYERYNKFSSERGRMSAQYVRTTLLERTWCYINNKMINGPCLELVIEGKKCLLIHGSKEDFYWTSITPDVDCSSYADFDYVFSGHSHIPHLFEKYVNADSPIMRNKKRIVFVNPGSVGQPRNHNNNAQYMIWDTETESFEVRKVKYDIIKEQASFNDNVDDFYKERLSLGI